MAPPTQKREYLSIASDAVDLGNGNNAGGLSIVGFRVGSLAGDVKVTTSAGTDIVIPNVQIGEKIALACTKVWQTGTTAQGITGFL